MLFSSGLFLFLFLPISLLLFYISPKRLKNAVLLLSSLVFYAWGGVNYTAILVGSIILNYVLGICIHRSQGQSTKWILGIGITLNLSLLMVYKYAGFFIENINRVFWKLEWPTFEDPGLLLPVGISFFTFQSISYLVDIYRKEAEVQKNFINLALYISLFPQLIAGPIVRYHDIAKQLVDRTFTLTGFGSGVERFIIGLAKKVLFANTFALVADNIFALSSNEMSTTTAWLGILCYSLQIYYDFSGYSDMAIGLGKMFGFDFLENFNFPYVARSIQDFWRRWHISLSNWFRDYLYLPLGGNRVSSKRLYVNLFIVFFLTGFWHGSSWNFIFWGLLHGFFIVLERIGLLKILQSAWRPLQHIYTLLVVVFAWVFFRAENLAHGWDYCKHMLGLQDTVGVQQNWRWYVDAHFYFVLILALLSAGGLWPWLNKHLKNILFPTGKRAVFNQIVAALLIFCLFSLSVTYLVSGTYNPFIYFRF